MVASVFVCFVGKAREAGTVKLIFTLVLFQLKFVKKNLLNETKTEQRMILFDPNRTVWQELYFKQASVYS